MPDFLKDVNRAQLIRYVAIYMLVAGVLSVCGGLALITAGALAGIGGVATGSLGSTSSEAAEAGAALVAVGGLAAIYGVLSLITGPIMVIVALGLFRRMGWARMGAVVACGLSAVSSLIGLLTGAGIFNLVWILVGGYLAYYFYTDPGIKQEFGAS